MTAYQDATIFAHDASTGAIQTTRGDVNITTFGSLSGTVQAGHNAFVFVDGPISQSVQADHDATVTSSDTLTGSVTDGHDAFVLGLGTISGPVTAHNNAQVSSMSTLSGPVTATRGSATVTASGAVSGAISAGQNATVWTNGTLTGPVSAGQDASAVVWGEVQAPVSAGRDASIFTDGQLLQSVTADRNVTVTAASKVSGTISAGKDAQVTVLADLQSEITAGETATVFALGLVNSPTIRSTGGDVSVTAVGDVNSVSLQAAGNLSAISLGRVLGTFSAGQDADIEGYGVDVQVQGSAGGNLTVHSLGTLSGTVTAGGDADLLAMGTLWATVTAGGSVSVAADGTISGQITATTGSGTVFSTGSFSAGSLTAGQDATVGTLGGVAVNVTAGGKATVVSLGAITGSTIRGQTEALAWSHYALTLVNVESSQGEAVALCDSTMASTTVTAGTNAVLGSVGGAIMTATVTAGGQADILGQGATNLTVTAGRDVNVLSDGLLTLSFTAGGDTLLQSAGAMTAVGSAGGSARLCSYGTLGGSVSADGDLWAWALGSITGTLQAAGNVYSVVTYGSLLGSVAAVGNPADGHGNIISVNVWNNLDGSLSATDIIGTVYVGGTIGLNGLVSAPVLGGLATHNRSPIVDHPGPLVVPWGALRAETRGAVHQLHELAQEFQEAATALHSLVAATSAATQHTVSEALGQLQRERLASVAALNDIQAQVQLSWIQADAKYQQALTNVRVLLETGRWGALNSADQAEVEVQWQEDAVRGETAARRVAAMDDRAFTVAEAGKMAQRQGLLRAAQLDQAAILQSASGKVFIATFIEKLGTYAVDKVQNELEKVALVASFIPGVGTAIAAVSSGINAAIFAARGKYAEASLSLVAMVPFGTILKKAGAASAVKGMARLASRQVGQGLKQAKFVKVVLKLGSAARTKACPVLRKIGINIGCFVDGTLVVIGEEWVDLAGAGQASAEQPVVLLHEERFGEWDRVSVVVLAGTLVLTLVGWRVAESKGKRRPIGLQPEDEVWLDWEKWQDQADEGDQDREALIAELTQSRLGLPKQEEALSPVSSEEFFIRTDLQVGSAIMSKQENELGEGTTVTGTMTTGEQQPQVPGLDSPISGRERSTGNGWKWFGRCWLVLGLVLCLILFLKAMPRSPQQVKTSENAEPAAVVANLSSAGPQTVKPPEPVKQRVLKTRPIEQFRVCQRVLGRNPNREEVEEIEEPDPKTWKMLEIELVKPSGKMLQATMVLSPEQFEEEYEAKTGTIELDRPELGAEGTARVLRISPCPTIEPGPGHVVTATFKHQPEGELLTVTVAGEEIGCTANHPFWSEDRQEFVEAGALRKGERVLTRLEGIAAVASIKPRPSTNLVYNLEVQGEHVYEVSSRGVLVHNNYADTFLARLLSGKRILDLTNTAWRQTKFRTGSEIIYILRDRNTRELLKVGKTTADRFIGRFERYVTAGKKHNRDLELLIGANTKSTRNSLKKTLVEFEDIIRKKVEGMKHKLPWDNTNQRLGIPGPGIP